MFRASTRTFSAAARVINFNAGPAGIPLPVLQEAQRDLTNWKGCGMGVMEMSHRSKEYDSIHVKATEDLKSLLKIPDNYKVLFLQGGASTQFSAVPLNLMRGKPANYLVTGSWSKGAYKEAARFGTANVAWSGAVGKFTDIAPSATWNMDADASYLYYCDNETVNGVEFAGVPDVPLTLVADMSSNFISKPVDVSKFGMIYAGAQKNVGPAGVTICIVREDLMGHAHAQCPSMLDYKVMADADSLYNTPPCFSIYMAGLVFDYQLKQGGLETRQAYNKEKADLLYGMIDNSDFYHAPVAHAVRSRMNVPFRVGQGTGDDAVEKKFIKEATAAGMEGLKGHRSVGGCRASIYNSVSIEEVQTLVAFMKNFELANK